MNIAKAKEAKLLFVSDQTAFAMDYLVCHEDLQFRGYLSAGAAAWAGAESLFAEASNLVRTMTSQVTQRCQVPEVRPAGKTIQEH